MNYLERMTRAHETRPDLFPPGQGMYLDFDIKHDAWCPLMSLLGLPAGRLPFEACDESGCRPDIRFPHAEQSVDTPLGGVYTK